MTNLYNIYEICVDRMIYAATRRFRATYSSAMSLNSRGHVPETAKFCRHFCEVPVTTFVLDVGEREHVRLLADDREHPLRHCIARGAVPVVAVHVAALCHASQDLQVNCLISAYKEDKTLLRLLGLWSSEMFELSSHWDAKTHLHQCAAGVAHW